MRIKIESKQIFYLIRSLISLRSLILLIGLVTFLVVTASASADADADASDQNNDVDNNNNKSPEEIIQYNYRKVELQMDKQEMEIKNAFHTFNKRKKEQIKLADGDRNLLDLALKEYESSFDIYQKQILNNLKNIHEEGQKQLSKLKVVRTADQQSKLKTKNKVNEVNMDKILNQRITYYQMEIRKRIREILIMIVTEKKKHQIEGIKIQSQDKYFARDNRAENNRGRGHFNFNSPIPDAHDRGKNIYGHNSSFRSSFKLNRIPSSERN